MAEPVDRRARVLTSLNLKGGVGKTHVCWLLASVCEERQRRILLIDTDPRGNLSNSFLPDRESGSGVERLLDPASDADVLPLVRRTAWPHIDIIPASPLVARFDESDQKAWEQADLHRSFVDPVQVLRPLYETIVFDCPPRLSLVSYAALCASDGVLVPLEAADWGAQGIVQVTDAIEYVQKRHNADLRLLGYLISRFKPRRAYQKTYLEELRKHFGPRVFDTVVPDLAPFERSVTDRVPITRHAPKSRAASIARSFADEVVRRAEDRGAGKPGLPEDDRRPLASAV